MRSLDELTKALSSSSAAASSEQLLCLILTAEDLAKEKALAKIRLDLTDSNLLTLSEQIQELNDKLQNVYTEAARLKLNHKEDMEFMTLLKLKSASICKTMENVASQVKDAESEKVYYTNKLSQTSIDLETLHGLVKSLSLRVESSEETITPCRPEIKTQDFQIKHSESEILTSQTIINLQSEIHGKEEEIDTLWKQILKHEEHVDSLEKHLSQAQKLLAETGSNAIEAKKQFNQMLESKQFEFLRALKRTSQRNEQAIRSIRRLYEVKKKECIEIEKVKVENAAADMEKRWDQNLSECQDKSEKHLIKLGGDYSTLVNRICEEIDKMEADLNSIQRQELKKLFNLAENELRERTKLLQNKCETELEKLRSQLEKDLGKELNLQKEKEEKQKALLQASEDKEVTSRKENLREAKTGGDKIDLQKMICVATSAKASKDLKSKREKERKKNAEMERTAFIGNSPVSIEECFEGSGDKINLESLGLILIGELEEDDDQTYEDLEEGEFVKA